MWFFTFVFILIVTPYVATQSSATTEANKCGEGEFRCKNGVCVPAASRCNGSIECADRSDETFANCRNNTCPETEFRCTYGACVKLSTTCDDKQDCADNSDELLPICRNDVDRNICRESLIEDRQLSKRVDCENSRNVCDDGQVLKESSRCNGKVDCADKSDESLSTCADAVCVPPLFQCAYGGCVHRAAQCDGIEDCADGSDESFELCDRILSSKTTTTTPKPVCILPPQPAHGSYVFVGNADALPGQEFDSFVLMITCEPQYGIFGNSTIFCYSGFWSDEFPKCVRFCRLPKHPSVEYRCPLSDDGSLEGTRECGESEPDGTTVQPRCRQPVYYYPGILFYMHCIDGKWDNIVVCTPECGKLGSPADALLVGSDSREARRNELPWHVAIYKKKQRKQICGGTVVSNNLIISAAHCFWNDVTKLQPTSNYMVAAGKLYRAWNHPNDTNTQTSEIREIKIPARFQGAATNFQDDIAVLILSTNLRYTLHVRPVCIDFDYEFDGRQLKEGSVGKIAGWGRTSETSGYSEILRVADVPYVTIQECIADIPTAFIAYITSDKICAGYKNGTALCEGDSGGGLAFPERERGAIHYYLRGVASTAVNDQHLCNSATITSFTHVTTHDRFIQNYI